MMITKMFCRCREAYAAMAVIAAAGVTTATSAAAITTPASAATPTATVITMMIAAVTVIAAATLDALRYVVEEQINPASFLYLRRCADEGWNIAAERNNTFRIHEAVDALRVLSEHKIKRAHAAGA